MDRRVVRVRVPSVVEYDVVIDDGRYDPVILGKVRESIQAGLAGWGRASLADSRRSEGWFWAIALVAFGIGTALTHLTPRPILAYPVLQLLLWAVAVAAVVLACRRLGGATTAGFWGVFVLTRPLGAAVAFLLTNASAAGGLGLARHAVSAVLTAVLVGSVRYR